MTEQEQEAVRVVQLLFEGAGVELPKEPPNPFQFWTTREQFEQFVKENEMNIPEVIARMIEVLIREGIIGHQDAERLTKILTEELTPKQNLSSSAMAELNELLD